MAITFGAAPSRSVEKRPWKAGGSAARVKTRNGRGVLRPFGRCTRLEEILAKVARDIIHEPVHRGLRDAVADDRVHGFTHRSERRFVHA